MVDPLAATSTAASLWEAFTSIRGVLGKDIVTAYFEWDGTLIHGSEAIQLRKIPAPGHPEVWWYTVDGLEDYAFMRFPVVQSCTHELVGFVGGEKNPDAKYWRWVATGEPGAVHGGHKSPGPPSLKVDFLVIGYRPRALADYFCEP